ncbi:chromosome segregation protein Csm1/Pcs1-domain-containing protein [Plectosphaerella cucumerina]|uniref:Chromosome segregation protein Csm1/Pcs1-domain-containing protein n=1 Tax=Plectosphaerella cucumerina TaxID=40658 RepID=A0A8K0TNX9_9PEZI|nr:chromosome segregation protein Csm1/Pcs1-domain-containing protein [Plectosphaerella cucumerina]
MALAKRPSRLVGLIQESDADEISSDSLVSFVAESVSAEQNTVPLRRGRGRPPAAKVTKPAQRVGSRQDHGSTTNAARRSTRRALDQKSTNDEVQKSQRGRKPAEAKQIQGRGRGRPKANSNPATVVTHDGGSTGGGGAATNQHEIQDSQTMMLGEDDVTADVIMDDLEAVSPQKPTLSSPFKRATESTGSDAQLRRRVGDLTRKCEAWEAKYRELREIGIKEAEANFDRLKRQAEERTNVANSLIAQLQSELTAQRALVQEGEQCREQLVASEVKISDLTKSLADARGNIKSLSAKLSSTRIVESTVPGAKVPGSAVKGSSTTARNAALASSDALQVAQLKEDMYGDLTGLIVRGVKRSASCEAFDCIQTGRNGSLHFKLTIEKEGVSEGYDETQFTFEPQLDDDRDHDLVEFLPDYMTEEITFPRAHAPRFFQRLTRALEEQSE